jgi:hypothetical protein
MSTCPANVNTVVEGFNYVSNDLGILVFIMILIIVTIIYFC